MPYRNFLLAAALFLSETISAQRDLTYVTDINRNIQSARLYGRVLLFGARETYLDAFSDDHGLSRYSYPVVGGVRLQYTYHKQPAYYDSRVYFVLNNDSSSFLYRFSGTAFSHVNVPGSIVSAPVVFAGNLYVLSQTGTTIQLYRYNGATVTAVSSGTLPATNNA